MLVGTLYTYHVVTCLLVVFCSIFRCLSLNRSWSFFLSISSEHTREVPPLDCLYLFSFLLKLYYTVYIFPGFSFCCHIIIEERLQMPKQEIILEKCIFILFFCCFFFPLKSRREQNFKSLEDSQIVVKGAGTRTSWILPCILRLIILLSEVKLIVHFLS